MHKTKQFFFNEKHLIIILNKEIQTCLTVVL